MFLVPKGVDPSTAVAGQDIPLALAPGEVFVLEVYLEFADPGRQVLWYRAVIDCMKYLGSTGDVLLQYVSMAEGAVLDAGRPDYIYAVQPPIARGAGDGSCAPWLPFGIGLPNVYTFATPPYPPELIPTITDRVYLGEFGGRVVGDASGTVTIIFREESVYLIGMDGSPIPFTTDGVLIVPDDSTAPGRCCEGSSCRVVSPQECGGLFERGGNCDLPCECSEINPCTRFFLAPQGYDGLAAPWGRHIPYTAAPGDEIAFDVFVDREDAWPGISGWGAETLCEYAFTESGRLDFVPLITVDVNHPLYIYSDEPGWIAYYWGCGLPPVFTEDPPLVSSGLHSTMIEVSSPRYLGTMRYRVSDDAAGATVAYIPNVPESGIVLGDDSLPPFRTEGVRLDVMPQQVLLSYPPNGAIDARQPTDSGNPEIRYGWNAIDLTFSGNVDESITGELSIVEIGGDGTAPQIASIDYLDIRRIRVNLNEPIEPGAWTCVAHEPSGTRSCLGYLPGDVSGDGTSSPVDILKVIDGLNGVANPPLAAYQTDLDRSDQSNPADVLRLIDLLNGAGDFDPWNYANLPAMP